MSKKAFTLVELLVVVAIIGLIAAISVIALSNARSKSRDSKRVSDIKQIQSALELFFSDQGRYPTVAEWNSGSLYATGTLGTTTYLERIPSVPSNIDGSCTDEEGRAYYYYSSDNGSNYDLNFCLGQGAGSLSAGKVCADPGKLSNANCLFPVFKEGFRSAADVVANGGVNSSAVFENYFVTYNSGKKTIYSDKTPTLGQAGKNFTLVLVIKLDPNSNGYTGPFGKGTPTAGRGIRIYTSNPGTTATFQLMNGINQEAGVNTGTIGDNNWNHLVISVDRSANMTSYLNGVAIQSTNISSLASNDYSNSQPLIFGDSDYNGAFSGSMDMAAIYNTAVSAEEALNLYNNWILYGK